MKGLDQCDPGHTNSSSVGERGGRSVSRDRGAVKATPAATSGSVTATGRGKLNGMDMMDEGVDPAPAISSADLDQLMADFDLNDPMDEEPISKPAQQAQTPAKEEPPKEEAKPGGLAGALPGGLGAGLSGLPNPMGDGNLMGKLGDLAAQNPVTDVMSKGKDFLFKKFGL
ncbi:hypothetical protein Pmani_012439 [Petrolisthes manimaculis]|uniref:Uncharacterized protein n=1 Tax=Petrolisthes manimaculis TaxID=1843537 RepID=A0AAE1PXV4_9EUCA|nr:hypothetical protein Pmani_012439 [Petrolisthes manimaculis]